MQPTAEEARRALTDVARRRHQVGVATLPSWLPLVAGLDMFIPVASRDIDDPWLRLTVWSVGVVIFVTVMVSVWRPGSASRLGLPVVLRPSRKDWWAMGLTALVFVSVVVVTARWWYAWLESPPLPGPVPHVLLGALRGGAVTLIIFGTSQHEKVKARSR